MGMLTLHPLDQSYLYEGLLRYNYLPFVKHKKDDAPPLFTSEALETPIADGLADYFDKVCSNCKGKRSKLGYDQLRYRATRFNNALRVMHIPHPVAYQHLCATLRDHWPLLQYVLENTSSQIRPDRHSDGRVFTIDDYVFDSGRVVIMEQDDFSSAVSQHISLSHGMKYVVEADISKCFGSIYSHAIGWAIDGFEVSKTGQSSATPGGAIDRAQRRLSRNETHGIPIGPGTSHVISEAILAKVDQQLRDAGFRFVRFIDDYFAYTETEARAYDFIRQAEALLDKYLLQLNVSKLKICPLPRPFSSPWRLALTDRLSSPEALSLREAVSTLDCGIDYQRRYPDASVMKYAARAVSSRCHEDARELVAQYLLQLANWQPAIMPIIASLVETGNVKLEQLALDTVLAEQIQTRRSDSICWLIYIYRLLGLDVPSHATAEIVGTGDVMAMAALYATGQRKQDIVSYVLQMADGDVYAMDSNWLLLHEVALDNTNKLPDHLTAYREAAGLEYLAEKGVSFLHRPSIVRESEDEVPF